MRTIKKLREDKSGSILILTMLALVGAISIAVAMSSVSIVERKMTTKSRKSTTAFQSANSGIEWAMKKINDASPSDTIYNVFLKTPDGNGQITCPPGLFTVGSGLECKITFLERNSGTGERDLITSDASMEDVVAIRSSGTFGSDSEQVGRALEAYAMPNCGSDKRVADFCIEDTDRSSKDDWGGAVGTCASAGKRLCTAAELVAANEEDVYIENKIMAADIAGSGGDSSFVLVKNSTLETTIDDDQNFRCCRNR